MYSLDVRRCPHCAAGLALVQLDGPRDLGRPRPLVVCRRCDGIPQWERALFVPRTWSNPR